MIFTAPLADCSCHPSLNGSVKSSPAPLSHSCFSSNTPQLRSTLVSKLRCSTRPVARSTVPLPPSFSTLLHHSWRPHLSALILSFPAAVLKSKTAKLLCCATAPLPVRFSAPRRNCMLARYASAAHFTAVQLGLTATLRHFTLAPWLSSPRAPILKTHSLLPHSATVSLFTSALCPIVLAVSLCLCCKAPW